MLVHQGARSLEIWTGTTAPVAVMQSAAHPRS
jgi:shikimate 5-dehydrogenase